MKNKITIISLLTLLIYIGIINGARAGQVETPQINNPAYAIVGEEYSFSVKGLLEENVNSWNGSVKEYQSGKEVFIVDSEGTNSYSPDTTTGYCTFIIPAYMGSYYSRTNTLESNQIYIIKFSVYDMYGECRTIETSFPAFESTNGNAPHLSVNDKTDLQTISINESYTWSISIPDTVEEGTHWLRFYSGESWMYFSTKEKVYTFYATSPRTTGMLRLFGQFLTNDTSPYSTDAVWSNPSNIVELYVEKKGDVIPGEVTILNTNAEIARGENIRYSFSKGENATAFLFSIVNEDGKLAGNSIELTDAESKYEYPTASFAPGSYYVKIWFKGDTGYSDLNSTAQAFFRIKETEETGLLFNLNKSEGLVGEEITFSAFDSNAESYEIFYQTENGTIDIGNLHSANGAKWGTIELNADMLSITAKSKSEDGTILDSKTIPFNVSSYGSPEISIIAPDTITEGEGISFSVMFPKVEGSLNPTYTVRVAESESQKRIDYEKQELFDEQNNTIFQCSIQATQIPSSGLSIYAIYDPSALGWEPTSKSHHIYHRIPLPKYSISNNEIMIGTPVTVEIEKSTEVSYYALMLYEVDEQGRESEVLGKEIYVTCDSMETSYTFPGNNFIKSGKYRLRVRAIPSSTKKRGSTDTREITVTAGETRQTKIAISSIGPYYENQKVIFDIQETFEDYVVRVYKNDGTGALNENYLSNRDLEERPTCLLLSFQEEGNYLIRCAVKKEGAWLALSDPVNVLIQSMSSLSEPGIELSQDDLAAGKDMKIRYSLDNRTESATLSLYKGNGNDGYQFIIAQSLALTESETTIDGAILSSGHYTANIQCSSNNYERSECTFSFELSGNREQGPSIISSTEETYANREVTFSVRVDGATKLRVRYLTNENGEPIGYSKELNSNEGLFSWTDSCNAYDPALNEITWKVYAMAQINNVWTNWCAPKLIKVKYRGKLMKPAYTNVPTQLKSGEDLIAVVTEIENATEYRFSLYKSESGLEKAELIKEWNVNTNAISVKVNEGLELNKNETYVLECYAFAEEFISSEKVSSSFRYVSNDEPQSGQVLVLPAGIKRIEESSFESTNAKAVVISEGCISIGAYAFARMSNLRDIYIPDSIEQIENGVFDGCSEVTVHTNSELVKQYATKYGFTVEKP